MVHLLFAILCLVWGTSFMLIKHALEAFGPVTVGAGRLVLGSAGLWLVWALVGRGRNVPRRDWLALAALAVVGYMLPYVVQPVVIRQVEAITGHGSSLVGVMVGLVPLFTVVASVPMLGIWPTRRQVVGVVGGLVFLTQLFVDEWRQDVPLAVLGLGMVTPLTYAIANTFVKRRFGHVSPMALSASALSLSGMVLVPASLMLEPLPWLGDDMLLESAVALLVLGTVATGVAQYLFYVILAQRGPLFAGMVSYVIPCVAVLVGWLMGETITGWHVICLGGILSMVGLVQAGPGPRELPAAESIASAAGPMEGRGSAP